MTPYEFHGTDALCAAISNDPDHQLNSNSILQWSNSERNELDAILDDVKGITDPDRDVFLVEIARILVRAAYLAKYSLWKARKNPELPFGPQHDLALIDSAMEHLARAASDVENISIPYGLRVVPVAVHGRIVTSVDDLALARRQLANEFPAIVHGKRKIEKDQKSRLAYNIARAYCQHLGVNPTSTVGGPFSRIFYLCAAALGMGGGRWGDYYEPAFARLGLPIRSRTAK